MANITIVKENIDTSEAFELIEELSEELSRITGASGRANFHNDDMKNPRSLFVIAREEGKGVGCGAFRELSKETAEIKRVYARRKACGIGRKILFHLEGKAKELGYSRILLETRKCNENAVSFYLRCGYQVTSNYGEYVNRPEAVCFSKEL
ncbi:MAG TPA: GNAT family N-acetyltransferase [Lachnospiraceae bacterium]|nr:GNAT family N-acetyltransferase [Lachnospiraceae bacterium]